jgi:hypothetical protein
MIYRDHADSKALRAPAASRIALASLALLLTAGAARADAPKPKLGPDAIPIERSHGYLQRHAAPDYWALSPYYVPQATGSACSLAAIAMLVNALRGLPSHAEERLVTQRALLDAVGSREWVEKTRDGGPGVTWDEFEKFLRQTLQAFRLDADVTVLRPRDASAASLAELRRVLADNEASDRDFVLVYYDQGVLTGDWDGPHIAPVGAYDEAQHQVLMLDVDREWYVPYWSRDERLLAAMLRPAPVERGALAGQTGGLIRVRKAAAAE